MYCMISERSNLDFYSKGLLKSLEDDVVNENGNKPASNCDGKTKKKDHDQKCSIDDDETSVFFCMAKLRAHHLRGTHRR